MTATATRSPRRYYVAIQGIHPAYCDSPAEVRTAQERAAERGMPADTVTRITRDQAINLADYGRGDTRDELARSIRHAREVCDALAGIAAAMTAYEERTPDEDVRPA